MSIWSPASWREKPASQIPTYPSEELVNEALRELALLPPLVTVWEIEALKAKIADAAAGHAFVLQGGDCAENFAECNRSSILNKVKILLQMSVVLVHGLNRRVVRIGRFAGQYAKPRSSDTETRDGVTLPSYRGDLINHTGFTPEERTPDPALLLRGYDRAALTLNYVRSLVEGGFADLHHPENWNMDFVSHSPMAEEYRKAVCEISRSVQFMESILGAQAFEVNRVDFFTGHEALHLPYEQAQSKETPGYEGWYNLTTHFPWIGARTADVNSAHVEYMRGVRNPIGIKVGPAMDPAELKRLLSTLNPAKEPGRITLIHRFGVQKIQAALPPLIEAVRETAHPVLWVSDPMHGNTITTSDGIKTRRFEHILAELKYAFLLHTEAGSRLGGVHFELTGENVTECIGGARGLRETDLHTAYRSQVDPRLNYEQAMEMAMLIVDMAQPDSL